MEALAPDAEIKRRATETLQELVALNSASGPSATCAIGIHARATRPTRNNVRRLEMDQALSNRMKLVAQSPLTSATKWISDGLIEAYDQRGLQEHDVRCLLTEDAPLVAKWFEELAPADGWPVFHKADWAHKPISGIFFRVDFGTSDPLICFSKWSDIIMLKQTGIQALISNSRYSLADADNQVRLPDFVHFFLFKGVVFAPNWKQFEAAVHFKELTQERPEADWKSFVTQISVRDAGAVWISLKKSVRHQTTVVKAMSRPGRVAPSIERVKKFIEEHSLTLTIVGGELIVDPSNKDQIEQLLTIMADVYVTSDITDTKLRTLDAKPR